MKKLFIVLLLLCNVLTIVLVIILTNKAKSQEHDVVPEPIEESILPTAITTTDAPAAIGPYSQAIKAGNMVFVSGQLPINPETGEFAEGDIKDLARQSLTNIQHILEAEGLSMANVVKTTVFLADIKDFAAVNEVYATFFKEPFPARSAMAVKDLPKAGPIEIECIAVR